MMRLIGIMALSLGLAGCFGSEPTPPPQVAAPATPTKPAVAGVLTGTAGQGLTEKDVEAAFDAQLAALDAGQRRSWKGAKGAFGYVEAGPEASGCRDYSHTIYVAGRPRSAKGSACRDTATGWKIVS
jgi:surface antigen